MDEAKMMRDGKVAVLYVEDEPNLAELLRAGLGLFGIIVRPVYCSAEELLGKTNTPEFAAADIMFLDIRLPGLTGLELAKKLRKRGDKRPMVIVSAYNRPDSAVLEEIGAAFQPKPFDFDEIVHTIYALVKPV
jgi:DNA-binding response OmpR family regulator